MQPHTWILPILMSLGLAIGGTLDAKPLEAQTSTTGTLDLPDGVVGATPATLPVGTYGAEGSAYSSSWRNVARDGDRFCVEIGNSPPSPYGGAIRVLVSSLSLNEGTFYMDALAKSIVTGLPSDSLPDNHLPHYLFGYAGNISRGLIWKFEGSELRGDVSRLNTCLQASGSYQAYQCVWKEGSRWDETIKDFRPWTEAEKHEELASCQANPNV